jgi:hypothetical protein
LNWRGVGAQQQEMIWRGVGAVHLGYLSCLSSNSPRLPGPGSGSSKYQISNPPNIADSEVLNEVSQIVSKIDFGPPGLLPVTLGVAGLCGWQRGGGGQVAVWTFFLVITRGVLTQNIAESEALNKTSTSTPGPARQPVLPITRGVPE